jgi:HK97 family phage prohead protease
MERNNNPTTQDHIEKRSFRSDLAPQSGSDQGGSTVKGYAALFNTRTELWKGYFEEIAQGAFAEAIPTSDVRALYNHNSSQLLGRTKSGTLTISEDARGLAFECKLPESRTDIIELINRGDLDQCSFAFTIKEEMWTDLGQGNELRTILKVGKIYDVTLATYPAYEDATFTLSRSSENAIKERENLKKEREKAPETPISTRPYKQIARLRDLNIY